jgi:elongator complex protein 3
MGHPTDKVELIIMGGTFLANPKEYQYCFIKECLDGLNGEDSIDLDEAKRINETAHHRCTGLCIETRPDWCSQEQIGWMLEYGTTRVELGVQILDDDVYRLVGRGHTVDEVVLASARLRDNGFKVYYHWMPGLPGSTPARDFQLSSQLFSDKRFRPDGLKLYPTMVVEGTELERWYKEGRYKPYETDTLINLMIKIKAIVPKYTRISRVLRDIPSKYIVAGCKDSLRDVVKQDMKQIGIDCHCIRCREYGHRSQQGWKIGQPVINRTEYEASGGLEIVLFFEEEGETLFGLLRLRIQSNSLFGVPVNGERFAVIRELHIFGPEVSITQRDAKAAQHKGLGKALLMEAERIVQEEYNIEQIYVLSGIGAKEYYRDLGYQSAGYYMMKIL